MSATNPGRPARTTRRKLLRFAGFLLIGPVLIALIGAAGFLGWRAMAQAQTARAMAIKTPNGVQQSGFIELGGTQQWVSIRGQNRDNPVLLIVGGDGGAIGAVMSPYLVDLQPWEKDFTVVTWDHRGSGKTFQKMGRDLGPNFNVEQLAVEGTQLADHLRRTLSKKTIAVMGLSFGSTVATRMVETHPDRFSAYVAAYQVSGPRLERERFFYERLSRLVRQKGDPAEIAALHYNGPNPLRDPATAEAIYTLADGYRPANPQGQFQTMLTAPNWSLSDIRAIPAGYEASEDRLMDAWDKTDFGRLGQGVTIPVVVIQGDDNDFAPLAMTTAWLDRIPAPVKVMAPIPGAGGHAIETHTAAFLDRLNRHVRPLALAAQ